MQVSGEIVKTKIMQFVQIGTLDLLAMPTPTANDDQISDAANIRHDVFKCIGRISRSIHSMNGADFTKVILRSKTGIENLCSILSEACGQRFLKSLPADKQELLAAAIADADLDISARNLLIASLPEETKLTINFILDAADICHSSRQWAEHELAIISNQRDR